MTPNQQNPEHWINNSTVVHDDTAVEVALQQMVEKITQLIEGSLQNQPVILLCVMNGGLYLAGQLMARLKLPMRLDYVQANRYHQGLQGESIRWSRLPALDLNQQTVLVVDDILDEGITLAEVVQHCQQAGAKNVLTAVLTEKDNGLKKPIQADFVGLSVPNEYVFGCGMDVYGWWRNLSHIRALI